MRFAGEYKSSTLAGSVDSTEVRSCSMQLAANSLTVTLVYATSLATVNKLSSVARQCFSEKLELIHEFGLFVWEQEKQSAVHKKTFCTQECIDTRFEGTHFGWRGGEACS